MESYLKTSNSHRYVIEDSIPKATSDGQPHEMMTLVAGLSGLLAAVVVLSILAAFIGCNKPRPRPQNRTEADVECSPNPGIDMKLSTNIPTLVQTNEKKCAIATITNTTPTELSGISNFGYQSNEGTFQPKDLNASKFRLFDKKY